MKKLKIALLIHKGLLPPENADKLSEEERVHYRVEYDVLSTLRKMKYDVIPVEMYGELEPLRRVIEEDKPDIAFNLLEDFPDYPMFDQQVINYLEMKKIRYTGCNPRGLMLAKDKALSKKILAYHNIRIPGFEVFPLNKKIKIKNDLNYPLFVKSLSDEGSIGISKESLVSSEEKLKERINFLHSRFSTDVIAEEFIDGREIYVAVMGNDRLRIFTPWELILKNDNSESLIATSRLKWDIEYQKKVGLITKAADISTALESSFKKITREIYLALKMSGYARIDYRLTPNEDIYLLEANPNPFIALDEDFADSAKHDGIKYEALLKKFLSNGLNYNPFGKGFKG